VHPFAALERGADPVAGGRVGGRPLKEAAVTADDLVPGIAGERLEGADR